jgi:hypothetical protein
MQLQTSRSNCSQPHAMCNDLTQMTTVKHLCRVDNPDEADVFFIPIRHIDVCLAYHNAMAAFAKCGIDHGEHHDLPGMWRWLLQQPSFRDSDGSDHFLFLDLPFTHLRNENVRLPMTALICACIRRARLP